jgi:hypothetical protein
MTTSAPGGSRPQILVVRAEMLPGSLQLVQRTKSAPAAF